MPPRLLLPSHPQAPRLLMTRAEFEAADKPGTRVEWLGNSGETRDGEILGRVWPVNGFLARRDITAWPPKRTT